MVPNFENRKSIHIHSHLETKNKLDLLKGLRITKVTYVISNYQERTNQYDGYHLVDEGIFIELSNKQVISWIWSDDGPEIGYYYGLYLEDMSEALKKRHTEGTIFLKGIGEYYSDSDALWVDVSTTKEWSRLIGKKIDSINYRLSKTDGFRDDISDIIIEIGGNTIYILSIDEPEPSILPVLDNLKFSPDWTIVIFDEDILNHLERESL